MSRLRLAGLGKSFAATPVVTGVDLDIAEGEMVVLLGPSGCGKTTILRMVAGFVTPSTGDILIDDASVVGVPPHRRDLGLVFQSYALFPHMTVARNVAFGPQMRGIKGEALDRQVADMLRLTRLESLSGRLPRQLSGGQQQRVALARALAARPRLLLLDEPLSNLDAALRGEVGRDIRLLQQSTGLTTVMVTHDQDEAMAMADRLVVMRDGQVQQTGTQEDLYERPATPFVASFIGRSNMLDGTLDGPDRLLARGAELRLAGHYDVREPCTLALRPERLTFEAQGGPGALEGTVVMASYLGPVREHLIRIGPEAQVVVRDTTARAGPLLAAGSPVTVRWDSAAERLFGRDGTPIATTPSTVRMTHDA